MKRSSAYLRNALLSVSCLFFMQAAHASLAGNGANNVLIQMPEMVAGMESGQQLSMQLALRVSGPKSEKLVRDRLVRLRHALLLHVTDYRPEDLRAETLETLADEFRVEANEILGSKNAVKAVLVQKFVMQNR